MHHHKHGGHCHHPLVGARLEGEQHVVSNLSTKCPVSEDGHTEVAQPCLFVDAAQRQWGMQTAHQLLAAHNDIDVAGQQACANSPPF